MLNRMVPKPSNARCILTAPFGTMTNRMVPKPQKAGAGWVLSFGTMTNRMVPKPRILLFNMIGVD